jgi:hypothetical protein
MLKVNYLTPIDRELCALCFHDLFKVPSAVVQEKRAYETDTCRYFWVHIGKSCFQKPDLLYERFIIMPSDVEFNSEQNSVTVKLNSKKIQVVLN